MDACVVHMNWTLLRISRFTILNNLHDCGWCWGGRLTSDRDFRASLVRNKRTSDPTGYAVAIFSCHCDKVPNRSSLQEEKVILAHALRGATLHVRPMPLVKASW